MAELGLRGGLRYKVGSTAEKYACVEKEREREREIEKERGMEIGSERER